MHGGKEILKSVSESIPEEILELQGKGLTLSRQLFHNPISTIC